MFSRPQVNFVDFLYHRRKAPGGGVVWLVQSPGEVFSGPGIRPDILSQVCDPHEPLPGLILKGRFRWSSWFISIVSPASRNVRLLGLYPLSFHAWLQLSTHPLALCRRKETTEFPHDLTGRGWPVVLDCSQKYFNSPFSVVYVICELAGWIV